MIYSMTGFGRGEYDDGIRKFSVEIKTVNHRYCDFNIKMPRVLISLEDRIRKVISERVSRGKVDVFVNLNSYNVEDNKVVFNKLLADSYFQCLNEVKDRYELSDNISISLISRFPDVITLEREEADSEELWVGLRAALIEAVDTLVTMRQVEGEKLKEDVLRRTETLKNELNSIAERAPQIVSNYGVQLRQRIADMLGDTAIDESRIAMEIAMFADRSNIDEEIVRLNSHIHQLEKTLCSDDSIGRKLDFIIQEMNREANTIGSKANDLDLSRHVLEIKNEIEKIREQVQNIE